MEYCQLPSKEYYSEEADYFPRWLLGRQQRPEDRPRQRPPAFLHHRLTMTVFPVKGRAAGGPAPVAAAALTFDGELRGRLGAAVPVRTPGSPRHPGPVRVGQRAGMDRPPGLAGPPWLDNILQHYLP